MPAISRVNLTVARVADYVFVPNPDPKKKKTRQSFLRDSGAPGLAVRATLGGDKSYIFESRLHGNTVRITIGACAAWSLPKAREEARRLQRLIDQGKDPRVENAIQRAEQTQAGAIVQTLWDAYVAAHRESWSQRHLLDNEWMVRPAVDDRDEGILRPLLRLPVSAVNSPTLVHWAKGVEAAHRNKVVLAEKQLAEKNIGSNIRGRNASLRKGFIRFRAFWRWAHGRPEEFGLIAGPEMFSHSDLRALIPQMRSRADVLERGQLAAWFKEVQKISNHVISTYLQCLLLTGARRNELGELKWTDVDFQWKSIHLKDKVEEAGRRIPLTPYVEKLLSDLKKQNEWVFASTTSSSGRITEPRIAHKKALKAAGLPSDLSLHGLRRSFSSLSEWVELPVGVVAQIMGHKPSATAERHYKVRPIDLLAQWHTKLENWILEQGGVEGAAVTPPSSPQAATP